MHTLSNNPSVPVKAYSLVQSAPIRAQSLGGGITTPSSIQSNISHFGQHIFAAPKLLRSGKNNMHENSGNLLFKLLIYIYINMFINIYTLVRI